MVSSTTGLPLEILLDLIDKKGMCVDWIDFYEEAIKNGWKEKTIYNRIETSTGEIYGSKQKEEILKRLKFYVERSKNG